VWSGQVPFDHVRARVSVHQDLGCLQELRVRSGVIAVLVRVEHVFDRER
jgi:hypothetical protein